MKFAANWQFLYESDESPTPAESLEPVPQQVRPLDHMGTDADTHSEISLNDLLWAPYTQMISLNAWEILS